MGKVAELALRKHDLASVYYSGRNDALSRFYSEQGYFSRKIAKVKQCPSHIQCQFCFTLFHPNNHKVRVMPRKKLSRRKAQLLEKSAKVTKTNNTHVIIICNVCHKKTKLVSLRKPQKNYCKEPTKDDSTSKLAPKGKRKKKRKINQVTNMSNPLQQVKQYSFKPVKNELLKPSKKTSTIGNLLKRGKTSKEAHSRLQNVLKQQSEKKKVSGGGLHDFLSSV